MSLVVLEAVSLGFGAKPIVSALDLRIADRDRIGLVGPNGSGKSTLLRLLVDEQSPDDGAVRPRRGLRIGYLPQDLAGSDEGAILDFVLRSVPGRGAIEAELQRATAALEGLDQSRARDEELMDAAATLSEAQERFAHFETWYSEHEAARILAGLGLGASDHGRSLAELSGGWAMRVQLAALLFQRPDLLLLDEPTNHLDMPSVAWFAGFLRRSDRAFVLICHDREFLNEQVERIVSFEPEGVRQYRGNYEQYVRQRAEEAEVLRNRARNLAREREQAERFIERFRSQANKARAVQSRIRALERLDVPEVHEDRKRMTLQFPPSARAGAQPLKATGLCKAFGANKVFAGLDVAVTRGQRIGLIGINGAGKTTLLRMLAGELRPDDGRVELGSNVTLGYYAQHHADMLDESRTVFQEVAVRDPSASETRVRTLLGAFLFSGEDVDKPVRVLSGGERARVALARLLLVPGNLLLMDEPTNHLDLESSEVLARALAAYDGTLLFVSHNRSFVRQVAAAIWNVERGGHVETYPGTLDDYLRRYGEAPTDDRRTASTEKSSKRGDDRARKRAEAAARARRHKRLGPIQARIERLEQKIETLEAEQKNREARLADRAVYDDDELRRRLMSEYERDRDALEELSQQWERAHVELEAAEAALDGEAAG